MWRIALSSVEFPFLGASFFLKVEKKRAKSNKQSAFWMKKIAQNEIGIASTVDYSVEVMGRQD
jgi:hypothetical protein